MSLSPQAQQIIGYRIRFFRLLVLFLFSLLFLRLVYLQIIKGKYFSSLAENNRIRFSYITPSRGIIKDRHGQVLAQTKPTFDLELLPDKNNSIPEVLNFLSKLLKEDAKELEDKYQILNKGRRPYQNRVLYSNMSRDQLALVVASQHLYPNLLVNVVPRREYLYPETNAHLLGYLREINQKQLDLTEYVDYMAGDRIGQQGLEKTFEHQLQGKRGVKSVTVNVSGQKIAERLIQADQNGAELVTSVDLLMQQAAERALGEQKGVVVALNPRNGEVLTLFSKPSFDPNIFNYPLNNQQWRDLMLSEDRPLSNKVIAGTYPPGSIFKIFMSYAGLAEDHVHPEDTVNCPGYFLLNGRTRFSCHKKSGHGAVNLETALAMSCNIYFYQLGQKLGVDGIHKYAHNLGLGELTGINIPGESVGLIPSTAWKKKAFSKAEDQVWYPGETPSVSIGQGANAITPIQIVRATATLLNDGQLYKPTLVKDDPVAPRFVRAVDIDPENLAAIKQGLWSVVNSERGTGKRASIEKETGIIVAGKTATSQTKSSKNLKGQDSENHAMFVGFAPYDQPEIVVFVLVEHGGHGGVTAAPVAKEVLLSYFRDRLLPVPVKEK